MMDMVMRGEASEPETVMTGLTFDTAERADEQNCNQIITQTMPLRATHLMTAARWALTRPYLEHNRCVLLHNDDPLQNVF
jgi:hypothetical protein